MYELNMVIQAFDSKRANCVLFLNFVTDVDINACCMLNGELEKYLQFP